MRTFVSIVPPVTTPGLPTVARGTKVISSDGGEIHGVTKIELIATPDDVWRARIECFVDTPSMEGVVAELQERGKLSWWRKALLWLASV